MILFEYLSARPKQHIIYSEKTQKYYLKIVYKSQYEYWQVDIGINVSNYLNNHGIDYGK